MMMAWLAALALQSADAPDPYVTIARGNVFAPAPRPGAPPAEPERPPAAPSPPRRRNVEVVGFLWDPVDEVRRVLLADAFDPETAYFYLKAGDEYLDAQIQGVEADAVTVAVDGEARTLRMGESFAVLDSNRPPEGTGRLVEILRGFSGVVPSARTSDAGGPPESIRDRLQRLRERRGQQPPGEGGPR